MLEGLKKELSSKIKSISDKIKKKEVDEKLFENIFQDFRFLLLQKNVAHSVIEEFKTELANDLIGKRLKRGEIKAKVFENLKETIKTSLVNPKIGDLTENIRRKDGPVTFLFLGVNGVGKTTTIAKFSKWLEKRGINSVLAASDTFRAASIEQLEKHADKLNKKVIKHEYGSDPASVAYDAIEHAKSQNIETVLIDTAGRMHSDRNLMEELNKIKKVSEADYSLLVIDALTGSDAVKQAKRFNKKIGVDGLIIAKADIDKEGGALLSVSKAIEKPIWFLGTGQEHEDLEIFQKEKIIEEISKEFNNNQVA